MYYITNGTFGKIHRPSFKKYSKSLTLKSDVKVTWPKTNIE